MTIEQLQELKSKCIALYPNGHIELTLLDALIAVLDAKIAELTTTDVDVQDAIADCNLMIHEFTREIEKLQYAPFADYDDVELCRKHIDTLVSVLAALRRQMPPTSEAVQKAIAWFSDRSSVAVYMNGEVQPNFHKVHQDVLHTIDAALQQYAPITEATQKAIEWQQALKQHHQREWEKTDTEWKTEPGAQEQHGELMASFDMAIRALQKAGE